MWDKLLIYTSEAIRGKFCTISHFSILGKSWDMENPNRLEIPAIFHKHLSQFFNTQDISIISEMFTLQNHFELYLVFSLAQAFFLLPLGIRIFVANEACLLKPQVEMGISENYANILQFEYSFSKACFAYAKFFLFFFSL